MTTSVYRDARDAALESLSTGDANAGRYATAAALLDALVLGDAFTEFLTIPGSRYLELEEARQGARA